MNFQSKLFLILFVSYLNIFGYGTIPDTSTVNFLRNEFYAAVEDEDKTYSLEKFIINKFSEDYSSYSSVILAYYGGVQALKAKHAFNPISQLSHLISGLNRLEEAIERSPDNLEIRFMRFSILDHVPGILGYSEERQEDLNKICTLLMQKNYSSINSDIQKGMAEYMIATERLNEQQKAEILALISSYTSK